MTDIDNERKDFEQWALRNGFEVMPDAGGSYETESTAAAWGAWLCRSLRAASLEPPAQVRARRVSVDGNTVDLIWSGAGWKAICPFHSELTPSLVVDMHALRYRCFGCGKRGDVQTIDGAAR